MDEVTARSGSRASKRPTLNDVAVQANVSGWTVSQVLNGRKVASESTRRRVLEVAAEVGYRPNSAARALIGSRTNLVALWIRSHVEYSSYYGSIQHLFQRLAHEYRYNCISEGVALEDVENPDFSRLLNWPVDGIIACDVGGPVKAYASVSARERMPIVCMGAWPDFAVDSVSLNLIPGFEAAARHLVETGCQRIAFASRQPWDMRAEAYRRVMEEAGKPTEFIEIPLDSRDSASEAFHAYAEVRGLPDGLLCQNDEIAIGCSAAVWKLGARIPDDIAIVGCDGIKDAEYQYKPLSTVNVPLEEMCKTAWEYLLHRMDNPDAPLQQSVVAAPFVIRESSRR